MTSENYTFYHGTSAAAARSIFNDNVRHDYLKSIGAEELAITVAEHILQKIGISNFRTLVNHYWEVSEAVTIACGSNLVEPAALDLWLRSLPYLFGTSKKSLFSYGGFFVTGSLVRAYRYACCNPYRSEFIRSLAGGIELLNVLDASLGKEIANTLDKNAELFAAMRRFSPPVVLEISGISIEDLAQENGSSDISAQLKLMDFHESIGTDPQVSFRLTKLDHTKITAIHDLRDWDSDIVPNLENTQAVKIGKSDWLGNF